MKYLSILLLFLAFGAQAESRPTVFFCKTTKIIHIDPRGNLSERQTGFVFTFSSHENKLEFTSEKLTKNILDIKYSVANFSLIATSPITPIGAEILFYKDGQMSFSNQTPNGIETVTASCDKLE